MTKNADQIDSVRALLNANYTKQPPAKLIAPFDERNRIAEESIGARAAVPDSPGEVLKIKLTQLDDSLHQNRLAYPEDEVQALAETMRAGQLMPLRVRRKADGRFEILAGHRRKRAALLLEWDTLDCLVVVRSEKEAALDVVVDNETHQGLSDFERAKGYKHLVELGVSQAELSRQIGVNRSLITNRLRLLSLPEPLLAMLEVHPGCMSNKWVPPLMEVLKERQDLITPAVEGLEKVALGTPDGEKWTMQTLVNDLKKRASGSKAGSERPVKLSITNQQNKEVLTLQRDSKRTGVYEIRITAPHSFSQEEMEQRLVEHLKMAWKDSPEM